MQTPAIVWGAIRSMGGRSPALAVSLAAAACVWRRSHATIVGDDCTFDVDVGGVSWFVGGVGRVHVEGQWHAPRVPRPIKTTHSPPSADSSPHSTPVTREQRAGVDHVGEYTATRCGWTVGDVEVDTTVTVYAARNATVRTEDRSLNPLSPVCSPHAHEALY
jgi:hypothetical protein